MKKTLAFMFIFVMLFSTIGAGKPVVRTVATGEAELQLEQVLPQEKAKRAMVVAMTNAQADDVFTAGGNSYNPALFHSYADTSGFYLTVYDEGSWTAANGYTWHVDGFKLKLEGYDTYLKVTGDVSFDGTNYIVFGVRRTLAALEYLDSDDLSKINVEEMEPSENTPFLTVAPALIEEDRTESTEQSGDTDTSGRAEWISGQFSIWDGSHKVLKDIVKRNLNDEKSFDHISTDYIDVSDQGMMDVVNNMLENAGYSQRVEIGDLFIKMEFSAKNAFNATIKNTAFGIASYADDTVELIGIE